MENFLYIYNVMPIDEIEKTSSRFSVTDTFVRRSSYVLLALGGFSLATNVSVVPSKLLIPLLLSLSRHSTREYSSLNLSGRAQGVFLFVAGAVLFLLSLRYFSDSDAGLGRGLLLAFLAGLLFFGSIIFYGFFCR